ncbi:uncharacterized protein UMAG_06068 [Mycosarcoma maydis]|uniref:Uncharacterized protein n=1 Tax=Mycosarcoma maydis TaxID=5270 RepID=A0A0D1DNE8_MYCMD|nr:uncharacterized protein UMAG_06068 [Ustilago maydis 521]KIS65979.1 hypothetical protein UMAG_06068 [Ustilago maydis 521]|eukprot:XP_011392429.1 hypothetical protein UMAG_06068 [Ustilago maydis 521]
MAIFGLKSRKSTLSDSSSFTKHIPDSTSRHRHSEASDAIGDTPEFGQFANNRRSTVNASESSSPLPRNSNSMKKFFGSTRRKGSQSIDSGSPAQLNKNSSGSDYFNNVAPKRASRTSLNKPAVHPTAATTTTPTIASTTVVPSLSVPAGSGTPLADAVSSEIPGSLAPSPALPTGSRPSDLFAGKGVQWNQIDLTSRDISKPTDAAATSIDMQKFLKERRQWIPTFKDSQAVEEASVDLPKSLDQFTFATPAEVSKTSTGLKSLKDLEDTHKRKTALLDEAPLATATNGTIFEEARSSSSVLSNNSASGAAAATVAAAGSKSPSQMLPPPPAPPSRNQSFRTSTFAAADDLTSARKSASLNRKPAPTLGVNGGGGGTASSTSSSRDIPQRRSSVRKNLSDLAAASSPEKPLEPQALNASADPAANDTGSSHPVSARVDQIKEQAATSESPVVARPATAVSTRSVAPSVETSGFATPIGSQSQNGDHVGPNRLVQQELPSARTSVALDATQDSNSTVAAPTSPPRPPKNEQRTPSRQSSKVSINSGALSKSPSTTFTPAVSEQAKDHNLVNQLARAAPALQNVLPGTGATGTTNATHTAARGDI